MENPFSYLGFFVAGVFGHLVTLLAGCVVTVMIGILEKYVLKRPVSLRMQVAVLLFFLFWACFQAWQDEHRNTQTVIGEKSALASSGNMCAEDLKMQRVYGLGLAGTVNDQRQTIDSERQMNSKQQIDVNRCVVSLGQMNPLVNTKIRALATPVWKTKENQQFGPPKDVTLFQIVIMTNHRSEPRGILRCDHPFKLIGVPWLVPSDPAGELFTGPVDSTTDKEHSIAVHNTAAFWIDENPIYVPAVSDADTLGNCEFKITEK